MTIPNLDAVKQLLLQGKLHAQLDLVDMDGEFAAFAVYDAAQEIIKAEVTGQPVALITLAKQNYVAVLQAARSRLGNNFEHEYALVLEENNRSTRYAVPHHIQ